MFSVCLLLLKNMSKAKILLKILKKVYLFTVKQYQYLNINRKNLQSYKTFLIDNYKIKTVNLSIQAINIYLKYLKKSFVIINIKITTKKLF